MIRVLLALMLFPFSALAQDNTQDLPHRYQPAFCDFKVDLPSAPYETQRCNPDKPNECVTQQSFTQVFELDATVNIRMICVEADQATYDTYTEGTTKAVLRALTSRGVVETYNTSFRTEDNYKQGGVVGQGATGNKPNLYLGQLWVGKNSVLTVEAELIGDSHDPADTLFRDILRSVIYAPILVSEDADEAETDKAEDSSPEE